MRYCKTCGSIFPEDDLKCSDCMEQTDELGLSSGQEQLFPDSEADRVKSLYQYHKNVLNAAEARVAKAQTKLDSTIEERDAAVATLINYDKLIKSQDGLLAELVE